MLADCRTIGAPFYAPRYWTELWEGGNRRVSFGGFTAIIRPLADADRAEDVRDHCEPTRALIEAVGDMRVIGARHGWWTDHWAHNLDGWRGFDLDGPPPLHVVKAIEDAYRLPETITEAHDEYAYWAWRAYGITMVMPDAGVTTLDALATPELDLVCQVRAEIVRRRLVPTLVASSLDDVELKLRMYVFTDGRDHMLEASVMRDLSHLRQVLARPASMHAQQPVTVREIVEVPVAVAVPDLPAPHTVEAAKAPRVPGVQNPAVTAELLRIPRPSDRAIAQRVGVSPTTVGAERERLIAAGRIDPGAPAFVTRCNVLGTYQMKARRDGPPATTDGKSLARLAAADTVTMKEPPPLSSTGGTVREQRVAPVPQGDGERSYRSLKGEQLKFPWGM